MSTFSYIPSSFQPVPLGKPHSDAIEPQLPHSVTEWAIIGESDATKRLRLQIRRIGPHFRTVLLSGEPGTGKQIAARALHQSSLNANGSFVASASGNRISYLMKLAQGGVLFFDRVNEMPLDTQDELLEILRRNEWAQDGLAAPQQIRPRIIASTSQDLRTLAASGQFRQELYRRFAMVQITLTPLRERVEDIPMLAAHFLNKFTQPHRQNITIANDTMECLKTYAWPGNVRELENLLEHSAPQAKGGILKAEHLPPLTKDLTLNEVDNQSSETTRLQDVVDQHILQVLKDCAGNKLRAAELLGISRSTLYRMLSACSAHAENA